MSKEYQRWYRKQGGGARAWLNEYKKTVKCERCGESHPATLDFHHPDPADKDGSVKELARNASKARVMEEVAKCIVLCANCHRKLHWAENEVVQAQLGPIVEPTVRGNQLSRIMKDKWANDPAFREARRQDIIRYNKQKAATPALAL